MVRDVGTDVGRAGQRIQRKVLVALVLSSVLPMLVLLAVVLPTPDPGGTLKIGVLQLLTLLTIVGMLVGDWVLWDLGPNRGPPGRHDGAATARRPAAKTRSSR